MKHLTLVLFLAALALLPACHKSSSSGSGEDDTGTDTDTDTDSDSDSDSDSDGDECPYECTSEELCEGISGTVHDTYECFFEDEVCCEWGSDTDSDSDTDTDTDVDTDTCTMGDFVGNLVVFSMADLDDAEGYTSITGDLSVQNCSMCNDLGTLGCLNLVSGSVAISNTSALPDLDGLNALTTVGGDLSIGANSALANLDALGELTEVDGDYFSIYENDLLPDCDVCQILDQLTSTAFAEINVYDNLDDSCTPVPDNCP